MNLSEWKRSGGDGDDDHVTAGGRDLVVSKRNNRKNKEYGTFFQGTFPKEGLESSLLEFPHVLSGPDVGRGGACVCVYV